ncbi:hypothetical protein EJ110_NYTH25666 [Nymphaea thermarum]|nr:hypothetical protein EJ110_NYTH25666 [Nymphaea thermarum]
MATNVSPLYESSTGYFSVHVKSRELVTAELPFPEIWLPLSNLDLLLPPIDCSIYSIYRKPSSKPDLSFGSAVEILKKSPAKVTKLMCEGIIVACTADHRISDAYSIGTSLSSPTSVALSSAHAILGLTTSP